LREAPVNEFKTGDKVIYISSSGKSVHKGIVKSVNYNTVFVVYSCGGDWKNYKDYTGAGTPIAKLRKGWPGKRLKLTL
jgi:hypothetical protein